MFKVGGLVIHPANGICRLTEIKENRVSEDKRLYVLKPQKTSCGEISILVPCRKVDEVGIRNLMNVEQSDDILQIMEGAAESSGNDFKEKALLRTVIKSGDIHKLVKVIRDLEKGSEGGFPKEIRSLLTSVKDKLSDEIAYVRKISKHQAENLIENRLMKNRKKLTKC